MTPVVFSGGVVFGNCSAVGSNGGNLCIEGFGERFSYLLFSEVI